MPTLLIADDHPLFRAALRGAAGEAADDIATCEAGTLDNVLATLESRSDFTRPSSAQRIALRRSPSRTSRTMVATDVGDHHTVAPSHASRSALADP